MRYAPIVLMVLALILTACPGSAETGKGPRMIEKKLIEYGWDVPTPAFIHEHIAEMTGRPFDGLIFKLEGGGKVLEPVTWDEAKFQDDYKHLQEIEWGPFTDNFVIMWAASDQDWFNDTHWEAIEHNVGLVARAARLGGCKGVCFDAEPYGTDPWQYQEAAHRDTKTFTEYEAKVRERGGQFLRAILGELPDAQIMTFFVLSFHRYLCVPMNAEMRGSRLTKHHYGLLPAFWEGMLDAATPGTAIIDGNEGAYYYTNSRQHFEAYHTIRERARYLVTPERWPAYRTHVRVGQALYIDQYFGLRTRKVLGHFMTPEERPKWFEHNVYWALYTTDRYVWCYSERMNWWTDTGVPPGCEEAIRSARAKIQNGQPLGFDLAPVVAKAEARQRAEIEKKLEHRRAEITRVPAGTDPPKIDGQLDDPVWQQTEPLEAFIPLVTNVSTLEAATEARVTYDARALYIAFRCAEARPAQIRCVGSERDDYVFNADVVEVFVSLPGSQVPYAHFAVNPKGVYWDGLHEDSPDTSFNPEWQRAALIGEDSWSAEIALPWAALNMQAPEAGAELRANLCRERAQKHELSAWSGLVSGFLEPQNFGTWVLK